jgi:Cytidylate kinase-like family
MPDVLHVRLVAPFEFRVRNYAQSQRMNAKVVRHNDEASYHFVRSYFDTDVADQLHDDVLINTEATGFEGAAYLICAALQVRLATRDGGSAVKSG